MPVQKFTRTIEETFEVYIKHHIQQNALLYPFITDLDKFIAVDHERVTVNLNYLKLDYVVGEFRIWYNNFIKFSNLALSLSGAKAFNFQFIYKSETVNIFFDSFIYKREFVEVLNKEFPNYEATLNDNGRVTVKVDKNGDVRESTFYTWLFQPILKKIKTYKFFIWVDVVYRNENFVAYTVSYN